METLPPVDPSSFRQVTEQLATMQTELTEIKRLLVAVTELEWVLKKYLPEVQNVDNIIHELYPVKRKGALTYNKAIQELVNQQEYLLECQSCGFVWTSRKIPKRCSGPKRCKNWIRASGRPREEPISGANSQNP